MSTSARPCASLRVPSFRTSKIGNHWLALTVAHEVKAEKDALRRVHVIASHSAFWLRVKQSKDADAQHWQEIAKPVGQFFRQISQSQLPLGALLDFERDPMAQQGLRAMVKAFPNEEAPLLEALGASKEQNELYYALVDGERYLRDLGASDSLNVQRQIQAGREKLNSGQITLAQTKDLWGDLVEIAKCLRSAGTFRQPSLTFLNIARLEAKKLERGVTSADFVTIWKNAAERYRTHVAVCCDEKQLTDLPASGAWHFWDSISFKSVHDELAYMERVAGKSLWSGAKQCFECLLISPELSVQLDRVRNTAKALKFGFPQVSSWLRPHESHSLSLRSELRRTRPQREDAAHRGQAARAGRQDARRPVRPEPAVSRRACRSAWQSEVQRTHHVRQRKGGRVACVPSVPLICPAPSLSCCKTRTRT